MPIQYIIQILNLPELQIDRVVSIDTEELHIEASPIAYKQHCPICGTAACVIRDGSNGMRIVRHLPSFEKKAYVHVPVLFNL